MSTRTMAVVSASIIAALLGWSPEALGQTPEGQSKKAQVLLEGARSNERAARQFAAKVNMRTGECGSTAEALRQRRSC